MLDPPLEQIDDQLMKRLVALRPKGGAKSIQTEDRLGKAPDEDRITSVFTLILPVSHQGHDESSRVRSFKSLLQSGQRRLRGTSGSYNQDLHTRSLSRSLAQMRLLKSP